MLPTSETVMKRFKPMASSQKQRPGRVLDMFLKVNASIAKGGELVDANRVSVSLFEADNEEMDYGFDVETESCITGVDHDPAFLVDFKDVKQTRTKGGTPTKPILDLLLRHCYLLSDPKQKAVYCCIADGCGYTSTNRGV